ncbi:MAG: hypothetical protein IKY44_05810 [Clostridia bacterium]|nr:hypothetical protein [Clostridia bacterium]
MFNEDRSRITLTYGVIKGFVSVFMHIVGDKRLLRKDRRIAQIGIFGFMAIFMAIGQTQLPEQWMKITCWAAAGVSLALCIMFLIIFLKKKGDYLYAEDHIVQADITAERIKAVVNGQERVIPLDGTVKFTMFEEFYIFTDDFGGFFLPFSELDPNEKTTVDLWFSRGAIYEAGKLKGNTRVPKLKF